jgi:hypothetical protein
MSSAKSFKGYFRCSTSPMGIHAIDATGEGVGKVGISCTPSKDFENMDYKNAIKHKNRGHPRFSHNSKRILNFLKMTIPVHLISVLVNIVLQFDLQFENSCAW